MLSRAILLVLIVSLANAEVVILDDSNYTSFTQQHPFVFVQFYAPWCGHCKSLAPEYEKLAQLSAGKDYVIAKIDATVAEKTSAELKVEGYPTLKFIVNGFAIEYNSGRKATDIQKWIELFFASKVQTLTEGEIKDKIGSQNILLIQGASPEQLKVLNIANFVDNSVDYYHLSSGQFKITLHLKNSKIFDFVGDLDVQSLTKWTSQNSLPALVPLYSQNQARIVFQTVEKLPGFLLLKTKEFTAEAFATLDKICQENKNVFRCAYADSNSPIFQGVTRYLKAEQGQLILAYVQFGMKVGYSYPNPNEITNEAVLAFIEEVNEGKVPKYIDVEADKKEKEIKYVNVQKLTDQTYNDTLKNNKYVFVQYYSPSCSHCVKFAPEFDKLAAAVKEKGLQYVIAAVNMPDQKGISSWVDVQGYPSLRLYIDGHQLEYNGDRNQESILTFIEQTKNTKLKTVTSLEEIVRPAVVIYGVSQDSNLNLLPIIYTTYPVYHIKSDTFKIEILTNKSYSHYEGQGNLLEVATWLQDASTPIIVGVVDKKPSKKLSQALEKHTPLLVVVKRDSTASGVLLFLQNYCATNLNLVCGYAGKDDHDYKSFNGWLADGEQNKDKTKLVYINTERFKKYIYEDDITLLTTQALNQFIDGIKTEEAKAQTSQDNNDPLHQPTLQSTPSDSATQTTTQPTQEEVIQAQL